MTYAGDISVSAAWKGLEAQASAQLIDVRTLAEWAFVGVPDISRCSRSPIFVEWQMFPTMSRNDRFCDVATKHLKSAGADATTPIYFLCRSGGRSAAAAAAMTREGYECCYNISDGFEGILDEQGHRGKLNGWKVEGFPWLQN